jgi:hypothetical protein
MRLPARSRSVDVEMREIATLYVEPQGVERIGPIDDGKVIEFAINRVQGAGFCRFWFRLCGGSWHGAAGDQRGDAGGKATRQSAARPKRPVTKPAEKERVKIGWSSSGPIYADEVAERSRVSTVRLALAEIADALGDVDFFIEQYNEEARKVPKIAAEIARRLLSAGRTEEAWRTIEASKDRRRESSWDWPDFEWEDARIDVLDALGRARTR